MKIGVLSDLHIDGNSKDTWTITDFENILAVQLTQQEIDILLLGGDISNDHRLSQSYVEKIKQLTGIPVFYVPGNHDYWLKDEEEKDTNNVLEFFKAQESCLIAKPYHINDDWVVVGHSGWYDYTYADARFSSEELSLGTYNGRTWQDKLNVDWKRDDQEVSKQFAEKVQANLEHVKDKNIILMTHMVNYKNFAVQMPHPVFDFFNAFIGTSDYDELLETYNIKYNIMGHVHYRRREESDGIVHICACLGNRNEWRSEDLEAEIKRALQVIEIDG